VTEASWHQVGRALLGRWPSQVATWGEEGIAAFVEELLADGLTAEQALVALRSYRPEPGKDFPPSVPAVVALARTDPSQPTPEEAYQMIYGKGGVMRARLKPGASFPSEAAMLGARDEVRLERAQEIHPLLGAFVERFGVHRLAMLEVDDPEYGEVRRKDVREAWARHCEAFAGREVAAIASGRRSGLGKLDPLSALGVPRPELEPGGDR
jgi:hypothetical protein